VELRRSTDVDNDRGACGARTDDAALRARDRPSMEQTDRKQLAEQHAAEAERLLAGRLGLINNVIKAGVHATLAVYYATESHRGD
jgi:hypothetical protein